MIEIDADGDAAAARWLPFDEFFDDLAINPFNRIALKQLTMLD
jgi:hypothetical protein